MTQINAEQLLWDVSSQGGGYTSPIYLQLSGYLVRVKGSAILVMIPWNCLVLYSFHGLPPAPTWSVSFDSNKHLEGRNFHHSQFKDEDTDDERSRDLAQDHTTAKWQNQDLNSVLSESPFMYITLGNMDCREDEACCWKFLSWSLLPKKGSK